MKSFKLKNKGGKKTTQEEEEMKNSIIEKIDQMASNYTKMAMDYQQNQLANEGRDYFFGDNIKNFLGDMAKKVVGDLAMNLLNKFEQ